MPVDNKRRYPKINEADNLNLAPTVSSTLTLVLGDAIACELSSKKILSGKIFINIILMEHWEQCLQKKTNNLFKRGHHEY